MAWAAARNRDGRMTGKTRLENFSDGVFSIASTLLVLELTIGTSGTPLQRVADGWPSYLAYLISFLTIGAAWLGHVQITDRLVRVDSICMRLNLVFFLFVAVLPFPTRLMAEGLRAGEGDRVFVVMYGVTLLAIRTLLFALDRYGDRQALRDPETSGVREKDVVGRTILPILLAYVVAIGVGLVFPSFAVAIFCAIAIYLVVPFRELTNLLMGRPDEPNGA